MIYRLALFLIGFMAISVTAQAGQCPKGTILVGDACQFEVSGPAKEKMIQDIFAEGPDGATAQQAQEYMDKVLGKKITSKLEPLKPQGEEDTLGWMARHTLEQDRTERCQTINAGEELGADYGQEKGAIARFWESIFGVKCGGSSGGW